MCVCLQDYASAGLLMRVGVENTLILLNIYEMTTACGFLVLLMHTLCILSNIIVHQVEWYVSEVLRIRRVALKSCFGDFMYSLAMKLFLIIPICVKSISNCRLKK